LCYEYGELVYHSIDIIKEFYEIISVKNNLYDSLKDKKKEVKLLECEIKTIKSILETKTAV
jgi:hypothetical protein